MLRTRLLTAAVALPALWLIIRYLPPALFAGFIMAVAAVGLLEFFAMAFPEHPLERTAGLVWGLVVAAGVAGRRPELWGAGLALAVIAGLVFPLARPVDLAGGGCCSPCSPRWAPTAGRTSPGGPSAVTSSRPPSARARRSRARPAASR